MSRRPQATKMENSPIRLDGARHAAAMPHLAELTTADEFDAPGLPLPATLEDLERLVRRDLDLTRYPAKSWVLPRFAPDGQPALDVLIVGGGQTGLAAAFGLLQQRVTNLLVVDENPSGQEGPWGTYARMATLRTQKDVGGLELGIAPLSFRAWYEVQNGRRAWDALYKIPTELWHAYLQWYRGVAGIPVGNGQRLVAFGPIENDLIAATLEHDGKQRTVYARTLVLATGIEGNGVRRVPEFVRALPRERWSHTQDAIDFVALRGRRVGVLGGAASAFDNAIAAAEHGAQVDLFHRSAQVTAANAMGWGEFNGYLAHFPDLSPADRWRFTRAIRRFKTGAPTATLLRARTLPNLRIHPSTTWRGAALIEGAIRVDASDGPFVADHLILGTGYTTDIAVRPEFTAHLPAIALWRDVFTPPPGEDDAALAGAPFLGPHFEMQEKTPGAAPWLASVFNFSRGAQMSMGAMPIGLSGIKFGAPRLVHGVTRRLFTSDAESYFEGFRLWQTSENIAEP